MSGHAWSGAGDADSLSRAVDQPVSLVPHDPGWASAFEAERTRLTAALPDTFVDVVHIGSTSIEGICAKPIIDLLAGVRTIDDVFTLHDALCASGYTTSKDFNRTLTDRQFYMRHADGHRTHHLHIVVHDSQTWRDRIVFRDRLRADPQLRARYQSLKSDLAARYADVRESYTEGKSAFIQSAIAR